MLRAPEPCAPKLCAPKPCLMAFPGCCHHAAPMGFAAPPTAGGEGGSQPRCRLRLCPLQVPTQQLVLATYGGLVGGGPQLRRFLEAACCADAALAHGRLWTSLAEEDRFARAQNTWIEIRYE